MKAVRLYQETHELKVESLPMPAKCAAGEVLVRTLYCGVCGSDYQRLYGSVRTSPLAIGHEYSGEVVEVGEGVTDLEPGDLVAVVPLVVCHKCRHCLAGNFGQCENSVFIGGAFQDIGGFVEYGVINSRNLLKLPKGINPMHAAFIEPLSVALHGLFIMGVKPGMDLAIVGVGTIGALALQCAKALGVNRIFAFDINPRRLELAKKLGAYAVYNTADEGFIERFRQDTGGRGVKQVLEACGKEQTIQICIEIADVEGNIALIGSMHDDVTIPPNMFYRLFSKNQLHMHGVWMSYSADFPGVEWRLGIQLIEKGQLDLDSLIYKLADVDDAQEYMSHYLVPNKINGKIMLRMTSED